MGSMGMGNMGSNIRCAQSPHFPHLQRQASPNIVIALAGNKADLEPKRMIEHDVGVGMDVVMS